MNTIDTIFSVFFMTFLMHLTWFFTRVFVSKYGHRHHHHNRTGSVLPTTTTTDPNLDNNVGFTRNHVYDFFSDYVWFLTAVVGAVFLVSNNDATFVLTILYTLCKLIGCCLHDVNNDMRMGRRALWYLSNVIIFAMYLNSFFSGYYYLVRGTDGNSVRN